MSNTVDIFNDLLRFTNSLKFKSINGVQKIWDPIRKKYLVKQEEEIVRQLVIQYFIQDKNWPLKLIQVEKQVQVGEVNRRFDILLYSGVDQAKILIECKSPHHKLSQSTFDQITDYNLTLNIPFLIVTNGIQSVLMKIDFEKKNYTYQNKIPEQKS